MLDAGIRVNDDPDMVRRSTVPMVIIVSVANLAARLVNAVGPNRRAADHEEAHVNRWKDGWRAGAHSAWTVGPSALNPYTQDDPVRANAWAAGAEWARGHSDRREPSRIRLAHPLRRHTDTRSRLGRVA